MTHDRIWSGRIGVLALNLRRQMTILSGTCVVLRVTRVVGPENPKGTLEMLSSDEAPEVIEKKSAVAMVKVSCQSDFCDPFY